MLIDYKFWYIKRDDAGFITEAGIRFYEGGITTVTEKSLIRGDASVTRYRRSARLAQSDLAYLMSHNVKLEQNGNPSIVYKSEHFGKIKTDAELCAFLNKEIAKDATRTVIDQQK